MARDVSDATPIESRDQLVDFRFSVVKRERGTRGGRHAIKLHHRLRTMMACAYRDPVFIQDGADIVRMHTLDFK